MLIDRIKEKIERTYGSLENPRFDFVFKAIKRQLYKDALTRLKSEFEVVETTDPNDDVAFCYHCISKRQQSYYLRLSMIGRFGYVYRDDYRPILQSTECELKKLLQILDDDEIELVPTECLEEEITMNLVEDGRTNVFNALFSTVEELPWKDANSAESSV